MTDNRLFSPTSPRGPAEVGTKSISLQDRLGLIALIDEEVRSGSSGRALMPDLFDNLWGLVSATVSGSRIARFKPEEASNGFRSFEITGERGESLGRLNMLYLKKPIPCYYLVYVEVSGPFRKNGLGSRILEYFKDFLVEKSAVGVLDNIIPEEDTSYSIYSKQGWEPLEAFVGEGAADRESNFMIYVPPRWQGRHLKDPLLKMVHHLKRKRAAIAMRDNEVMVQRTIGEFKDLYAALLTYFKHELRIGRPTPLTQFMFTRFATKLISFRRRIGSLVGYTGGESIQQIALEPAVAALPVRTYRPSRPGIRRPDLWGDKEMWFRLPDRCKNHPARFIESLPNYGRPSLLSWLKGRGMYPTDKLTIGDLMNLGFDPTRLKELAIGNEVFIFERLDGRQLEEIVRREELLRRIRAEMSDARPGNARVRVNPPLLAVEDMGNIYVLRHKVGGIHWEEAMDQFESVRHLQAMNRELKIDRVIRGTVRNVYEMISEKIGMREDALADSLTCFVPWDLENNQPRLTIDFAKVYMESVWMA